MCARLDFAPRKHDNKEHFKTLLKLYLFTLTPSAIADFQGGRDNKKKTIYIMQIKTVKLKYDVRID